MSQCGQCGSSIVQGNGTGVICISCYHKGWCRRCGKNKADKGFSCSDCWKQL